MKQVVGSALLGAGVVASLVFALVGLSVFASFEAGAEDVSSTRWAVLGATALVALVARQ